MTDDLVLTTDRHLKWRAFDPIERVLMLLCGVCLTIFSLSTLIDVVTRELGHPLLSLQEVTSAFFVYGIFIGSAVATRRNDHLFLSAITERMHGATRRFVEVFNRLVVLGVGLMMVIYGWQNFLTGFGSFRMPSMLPAHLHQPLKPGMNPIKIIKPEHKGDGHELKYEPGKKVGPRSADAGLPGCGADGRRSHASMIGGSSHDAIAASLKGVPREPIAG